MTVRELRDILNNMPIDADVTIEQKDDPCDVCSKIGVKCSNEGTWHWTPEHPYLHEASNEVRIKFY